MMKLFVGIDVSSKKLEVSMLTSDISAKPLFQGTFENDLNGATEVKKLILKLNLSQQFEKIVIGMEATSIYSFHPAYFFENDDDLAQFNTQAVIINPRDTKKYKDIFEIQKNDSIDAYYIADFLRLERYSTSLVRQEKYVALQRLTRSRFELVKSLSRSKQHFLENLYYKLNKLVVNDDLNTSVFGATMLDLLTEDFTTDDISVMPIEELADYLNSKGKGRFANPSALAKTIQKAIRGSYRLDK
ncbi:IS110 family transposase, partial [Leuconostoc falkenbergense]